MSDKNYFERTELLLGKTAMAALQGKHVIVFGVGGVGGWCAESLVRSGIGKITIVDSDCVATSNINRQLVATTKTIGMPKVEVLKNRLLEINPYVQINAIQRFYCEESADDFVFDDYDYVVDAIDSLKDKALLILRACESKATLFSSMGAALKSDLKRISVTEFWKVKGCPLAAALRRRFKQNKQFPKRKFKCVYSDEVLKNKGKSTGEKANGTLVYATAVFGFTLASLVVQDVLSKIE
ncbi:MAG: ThiF family adenylyltransferase [Paludibacteraceae bacterium]|nr:ThiF family adenylyltransferase [Paludibacteraceae bacterium]